jgi:hypothetical protein
MVNYSYDELLLDTLYDVSFENQSPETFQEAILVAVSAQCNSQFRRIWQHALNMYEHPDIAAEMLHAVGWRAIPINGRNERIEFEQVVIEDESDEDEDEAGRQAALACVNENYCARCA